MNHTSVFRDFVTALRKHWRSELPIARPIRAAMGPTMPKASTFYLGTAPAGLHLFLNFQHNSKAWRIGQFTVNVIFSETIGPPASIGSGLPPEDWIQFQSGSYRIGSLLSRKDKWWHLLPGTPEKLVQSWFATDYQTREQVIREAMADVTNDVTTLLKLLRFPTSQIPDE